MTRSNPESPLYVLDAHTLYWYWTEPGRLGRAAQRAFRELEAQEATGLVPVIVVLEIDRLMTKQGRSRSIAATLGLIDRSPALRVEPLTRRHLTESSPLVDISEMHDRMIASVALIHDATLLTRDEILRAHPLLRTEW